MALEKIKLANIRARHDQKRKAKHAKSMKKKFEMKIRNKRMRKMMIEGRKEHMARRREELDYINDLTAELVGDDKA